jgi:hypothetical protein
MTPAGRSGPHPVSGVAGDVDFMPGVLKGPRDEPADLRLVVDDQDPGSSGIGPAMAR